MRGEEGHGEQLPPNETPPSRGEEGDGNKSRDGREELMEMIEENKDQDILGKTPNPRDRDKTLDKNHKKPQKNIKLTKSKKIN